MDKCIFINSILAKEQVTLKNSYKEDIKNYECQNHLVLKKLENLLCVWKQ